MPTCPQSVHIVFYHLLSHGSTYMLASRIKVAAAKVAARLAMPALPNGMFRCVVAFISILDLFVYK